MTVRAYAVESMLYRTAGLIDRAAGESASPAVLHEYAVEASLLKVAGSEMLDFVLDENVQIHGGNGYVRDYAPERRYRDARVNRVFEGTNEINRLLVPGLLVKRALAGKLPLIAAARRLQDEILTPAATPAPDDEPLAIVGHHATCLRKAALMVLGLAMQSYGGRLQDEQEVLMLAADIVRDAFAADSVRLRAAAQAPGPLAARHLDAAMVVAHDACLRTEARARVTLTAMSTGDALALNLAALRRLMKVVPVDTIAARRRLADAVLQDGRYPFSA
jgi:hypothetical protein